MLKVFVLICFCVNAFVDSFPFDDSVIEEHIVGGNDTDISKVPYQIAMYETGNFRCGGFIVSPTHVVTAAHCVLEVQAPDVTIRAGSSFIEKGGVVVKIKKIYRNPKFSMKTVDYDVAVMELETPLKFTDKIKPIKMTTKEPPVGAEVLASGWGAMNENVEMPEVLQSVTFPIYNRTICEIVYSLRRIKITPRMICAGAEGKTAYFGDSGGPVVYKGEVIGIVSFGVRCGKKGVPGVYANIADPEINKFIKDMAKL